MFSWDCAIIFMLKSIVLNLNELYSPFQGPRKKKKLKTRKERNKRRAKAMKIKDVILADVARKAEVCLLNVCFLIL